MSLAIEGIRATEGTSQDGASFSHPLDAEDMLPSQRPYSEQVRIGKALVEAALRVEESSTCASISVPTYRKAAGHLLDALSHYPVEENPSKKQESYELINPDPVVLLAYGIALTRQLQGNGEERFPAIKRRRDAMFTQAAKSFETAFLALEQVKAIAPGDLDFICKAEEISDELATISSPQNLHQLRNADPEYVRMRASYADFEQRELAAVAA